MTDYLKLAKEGMDTADRVNYTNAPTAKQIQAQVFASIATAIELRRIADAIESFRKD